MSQQDLKLLMSPDKLFCWTCTRAVLRLFRREPDHCKIDELCRLEIRWLSRSRLERSVRFAQAPSNEFLAALSAGATFPEAGRL
jgi:hypothetical protein